MKFADWTFAEPAANLACDEVLLDLCEETGAEALRVWESPVPFVVVGYANRVGLEVNLDAAARLRVPVLRRCSGGGTVVQGPGCLSYAVVLSVDDQGPLATVTGTNQFVMERNRAALASILSAEVSIQGHTDLAIQSGGEWVKFSGNSQRRRRRSVLFHGTLLYNFDLSMVSQVLQMPSLQPQYREGRGHETFVVNIPAPPSALVTALRHAWKAEQTYGTAPEDGVRQLAAERYATDAWNLAR